jgi:hypothetical protein
MKRDADVTAGELAIRNVSDPKFTTLTKFPPTGGGDDILKTISPTKVIEFAPPANHEDLSLPA